ncbi:hydrogenase maturation nickel metallochaperone HypA [Desulfitispora alkaliphila]|uniref:hydrogenase maturation nickel metallochaperone HypA/HybF n=1 Tax=Desulfitispora alkaliphila TaxID=622674 RepID=UPI003D1EC890
MAIMDSMFKMIMDQAEQYQLKRVSKVKVVVGEMSGVVPDSLSLCFEILAQDTICQDAVLEIEKKELRASCNKCGIEFKVSRGNPYCPECAGALGEFVSGKELYIDFVEGEGEETDEN